MITRRTTQGMYLLRPSKEVNACIRYCIALAQRRAKIKIHCIIFMANHYHIVLTDVYGTLPIFTEEMNKNISKALNCKYDRSENFWSSGVQTSYVVLADEATVVEKTVYALSNPTAAGLVSHGSEWPGVRLFRSGSYLAKKPSFFFRSEDDGGDLPGKLMLVISPPPIHGVPSLSGDIIQSATTVQEKKLRQEHAKAGRRYMGKAKVKSQNIYGAPKAPIARRNMSPRVACKDKLLRIKLLLANRAFAQDYKVKQEKFAKGDHSVIFPVGTYQMVRQFGARCASI